MKFENTKVYNIDGALRGMRNPMNSWNKSDSRWEELPDWKKADTGEAFVYTIGTNDLDLAQRLIRGGSEHRKFLRQIFVCVDITAPLYWWKEFDTYKVGTVANSTSTMHKLATTPITLNCFEIDDYSNSLIFENPVDDNTSTSYEYRYSMQDVVGNNERNYRSENTLIGFLENLRLKYLETKDKKYWKELIRWLPESWLQKRTVTLNYENLYTIYRQRKNHKLNEWSGLDNSELPNFISWIGTLPYAKELIINK